MKWEAPTASDNKAIASAGVVNPRKKWFTVSGLWHGLVNPVEIASLSILIGGGDDAFGSLFGAAGPAYGAGATARSAGDDSDGPVRGAVRGRHLGRRG